MKKGIHPENYRPVVFRDMSVDHAFLVRSTAVTSDTIVWEDGNTYPLVKLEISNKSHPFFTGKQKMLDSAGRVERFNKKYAKK
ncbi:MAG: type B 50S ribosomal protein L31 [Melioribacteraceae bacterium]|nr:type B 50S ribosomal protein L31 [Melioribacteraceae bacterium]